MIGRSSTHSLPRWPGNKRFAFTVVDDTDHSTVASVRPVYDYLFSHGLRTTKTVWIYPPRDDYTGSTLQDSDYRTFVQDLQAKGFEIALHNVGSGRFDRAEILAGIELFNAHLGRYPRMQINHANNPDNMYSGHKRFVPPLSWLMKCSPYHAGGSGEKPDSELFWGDAHKKHITYTRNHTFNGIDTTGYDRMMPYRVRSKAQFSNYWFSSSDAHTVHEFNSLLAPASLDRLEVSGGLCIAYTHFNSYFAKQDGSLDETFKARVDDIASRDAWFAPASEILDHLQTRPGRGQDARYLHLLRLDLRWTMERIVKEVLYRAGITRGRAA